MPNDPARRAFEVQDVGAHAAVPASLRFAPTVAVAAAVLALAYANGGYGLTARTVVTIVLWWAVIVGVAFGLLPAAPLPRATLVVGGLLAAFVAWTGVSTTWASSAEKAFNEFNRSSMYLALFALAAAGVPRRRVGRVVDGLTVGLVAVAVTALATRLLRPASSAGELAEFIPNAAARLSFPVGYWNALGILVALALPLCLRSGVTAHRRVVRAAAVGAAPALAAAILLTSSRGGLLTAVLTTVVFVAACDRRWRAAAVAVAAGIGSMLAAAVLALHDAVVDGPLTADAAADQGRTAAVLLLLCCAVAAALLVGAERLPERPVRLRRAHRLVAAGAAAAAVALGVIAADPVERVEAFTAPPSPGVAADTPREHLLSESGSGRWQFWSAAVDQFASAPLHGGGAGSYEYWWSEHATFTYSLKNAHSLYLEALGELGLVGFLLVLVMIAAALATAVARLRMIRASDDRVTLAALTAVFVGFAAAAAVDWIWQVTVVGLVGIVATGLIAGTAFAPPVQPAEVVTEGRGTGARTAAGFAAVAAAWALICAAAVPWLAAASVADSQAAARRGDLAGAHEAALDARRLQPWAATPYLQLALVAEAGRDYAAAERWVADALRRSSRDWRVWYTAARIAAGAQKPELSRRYLERAAALNPRSPLFAGT